MRPETGAPHLREPTITVDCFDVPRLVSNFLMAVAAGLIVRFGYDALHQWLGWRW